MRIKKKDFVKAKVHAHLTPGEALRIVRTKQGLSQYELAKITGIHQANISALENDTRQMGRDRAIALAKALKVHPAVLLFPDFEVEEAA